MTDKKYYNIIGASFSALMLLFVMFFYMLIPFYNVKLNSTDETVSASGSLYLDSSRNFGSHKLFVVDSLAVLPIESTNVGSIGGYQYGSLVHYSNSDFSSTSQVVNITYKFGFSNLIQNYAWYGYSDAFEFETFLRKYYNNMDDLRPYSTGQIRNLYLNCGVINYLNHYQSYDQLSELISDANPNYDYDYAVYYDDQLLFDQLLRDDPQTYFEFTSNSGTFYNRVMTFNLGKYCYDQHISIYDFISHLSIRVKYYYSFYNASAQFFATYIPFLIPDSNFGFTHENYNLIVSMYDNYLDYSYYFGAENSIDYQSGYNAGNSDGYSRGWNAGVESSSHYTFLGLIGAVLDAPIQAFTGLFNFTLLGVNLKDFILGLFTICVILTIVKFVL